MPKACFLFLPLLLVAIFIFSSTRAYADNKMLTVEPSIIKTDTKNLTITINGGEFSPDNTAYTIYAWPAKSKAGEPLNTPNSNPNLAVKGIPEDRSDSTTLYIPIDFVKAITMDEKVDLVKEYPGDWYVVVCVRDTNDQLDDPSFCSEAEHLIGGGAIKIATDPDIPPNTTPPPSDLPIIKPLDNKCVWQTGLEATVKIDNLDSTKTYSWWWAGECGWNCQKQTINGAKTIIITLPVSDTKNLNGAHKFCIDELHKTRELIDNCLTLSFIPVIITEGPGTTKRECSAATHGPIGSCEKATCDKGLICQSGQCIKTTTANGIACNPGPEGDGQDDNTLKGDKVTGISTAIGCIPTDFSTLVQQIVKVVIGLAGGVALLLLVAGTFQMITSAGNPDKVKAGAGQITSALIGLLFIIFAVLLLQVIGGNILNIPGIPGFGVPGSP